MRAFLMAGIHAAELFSLGLNIILASYVYQKCTEVNYLKNYADGWVKLAGDLRKQIVEWRKRAEDAEYILSVVREALQSADMVVEP